jgi:predicted nucleotidyltransferase component of viral defense system
MIPPIESTEGLMVWLMTQLTDTVGNHAILKGGMALRLCDCPRHTNDLDYLFVPYQSKKPIVPLVEKVLRQLDGATWSHSFHSTSVRFIIQYKALSTQIEATVAATCDTEPMSTSALAHHTHQTPRIVRIMKLEHALAHKLAAWNERSLLRDLYDVYYLHSILGKLPDQATLAERLQKIRYAKNIKRPRMTDSMTLAQFAKKLLDATQSLNADIIAQGLGDYLTPEEYTGLEHKIMGSIQKLVATLPIDK